MRVAVGARSLLRNSCLISKRISGIQLRCQASLSDGKQPTRLRQASQVAKLLGGGFIAAGILVAALPSLLSTRLGLSASLAAVNLVTPGQVEVAKLEVGWSSPLRVQGLRLLDRQARHATPLVEVQEISCSAGLWQLLHAADLRGSSSTTTTSAEGIVPSCVPLVVQEASFNLEYDPAVSDFKLVDWLERAGLLASPPSGRQAHQKPPPVPSDSAARPETEPGTSCALAGAAPAAAASSPRSGRAPDPAAAKGRVAEMLSRADAAIVFSADLRMGRQLQLLLPHAQLKVPHQVRKTHRTLDVSVVSLSNYLNSPPTACTEPLLVLSPLLRARDMLGSQMHVTGALGTEALVEWAGETEQDISWAVPAPGPAGDLVPSDAGGRDGEGRAVGPAVRLSDSSSLEANAGEAAAAARVEHMRRPTAPAGYQPGMIQANSEHMQAEARLYCRERGAGPVLLHEPATATLDFTPALSRFGLEMINPLLSNAMAIRGSRSDGQPNSAVRVQYAPADLQLPAKGALLTVMPMRLTLASGSRIQEICAAMKIGQSVSQLRSLDIQTSGMQVHLSPGRGPITTDRVDMSIGPSSGTGSQLELSMWGTHDMATGALDMTLGLPAGVLKQLGIRDLPEGYLLPVKMKGTVDKPEVGYEGLVRRLAGLMVRQQCLAAAQQQEKLRLQEQAGESRQGVLLSRVLKVISSLPFEMDAVKKTEAEMLQDLASTPKACSLPMPTSSKDKENIANQI